MLPGLGEWLAASWADYRRRWLPLMSVLVLGGLATTAAVFLSLLPAGFAAYFAIGSPWVIWGGAAMVALLVGLWLSTWTQAAAIRAASNDDGAGAALRGGWRQTPAFAWALSLVMLAVGGGFVLLIVPGLILSVLLFFAPLYQMADEDQGMGAVELSFARVRPVFGAVCVRLFLTGLIAGLPSWIPYVGWLIGPLWAPFGLVACVRLAQDLKALTPAPARPPLTAAVSALSFVFLVAMFAVSWGAVRGARALYESHASGRLELEAPDAGTAQAMLAVLQGQGTDADKMSSATYVLSLSSAARKAAP
ncbi:MAG: hypothetical protein AAB268_13835 [Elusimicrobiota bacterium]